MTDPDEDEAAELTFSGGVMLPPAGAGSGQDGADGD